MNQERMLQLADFIENEVKDENFHMQHFYSKADGREQLKLPEVHVCGTTHCIGGWAVLLAQGYIKAADPNPEIAREFLGLDEDQADLLFFDWPRDKGYDRLDAVRRIREMAQTGTLNNGVRYQ